MKRRRRRTILRAVAVLAWACSLGACLWLYVQAHEAEEKTWEATCAAVAWQTRANALETKLQRSRP